MGALEGLTVVAIEHAIAAPYCTRLLADRGARIIKIERPGTGDFGRGHDTRVRGLSSHFVWANRGKQSIALDLEHPRAAEVLQRLVARSTPYHLDAVERFQSKQPARFDWDRDREGRRARRASRLPASRSITAPGRSQAGRTPHASCGLGRLFGQAEWTRKGGVLGEVTAQKEYGVTREFIVDAIRAGKLEYREGSVWGNPYFRIPRPSSRHCLPSDTAQGMWPGRIGAPNGPRPSARSPRRRSSSWRSRRAEPNSKPTLAGRLPSRIADGQSQARRQT